LDKYGEIDTVLAEIRQSSFAAYAPERWIKSNVFFAEQNVLNPFAMPKNSPKNIPKSVCIMLNPNPSCCK